MTFGKDAGAEQISNAIGEMQDACAKKFPERAHKLFPQVYDGKCSRITKDNEE